MNVFLVAFGLGFGACLAYLFGERMSDVALAIVVNSVVNMAVAMLLAYFLWGRGRVYPQAKASAAPPQVTVLPMQIQPAQPPPAPPSYGATLAPTALHYEAPDADLYLEV